MLVAPAEGEYVVIGHDRQVVAVFEGMYVPALHRSHTVDASDTENFPAKQDPQVVLAGAATAADALPAGQLKQDAAPFDALN